MNLTVLLHYVQLLTYYGYRQVESCTLAQLERKTDEKILYNTWQSSTGRESVTKMKILSSLTHPQVVPKKKDEKGYSENSPNNIKPNWVH